MILPNPTKFAGICASRLGKRATTKPGRAPIARGTSLPRKHSKRFGTPLPPTRPARPGPASLGTGRARSAPARRLRPPAPIVAAPTKQSTRYRRNPGEVLDTMRRSIQGVYQLAQSLQDFTANKSLRAVDENGNVKALPDGSGEVMISDVYLRGEFPPPGKARAPRPGDTPDDVFHNRIRAFTLAMEQLEQAFLAIGEVLGENGRPVVEDRGVDSQSCTTWRETIAKIDDELAFWGRRFKTVYGVTDAATTARRRPTQDDDDEAWRDDEASALAPPLQ